MGASSPEDLVEGERDVALSRAGREQVADGELHDNSFRAGDIAQSIYADDILVGVDTETLGGKGRRDRGGVINVTLPGWIGVVALAYNHCTPFSP